MKIAMLILFGLVGGILGGMGMGGGTLLIPLLTLGLNISQKGAQAINLLAFLPMSVVALIIHSKNHLVNYKIVVPIAISGVASAVLGAVFAGMMQSGQLSIWFGIFLIVVGLLQILSRWTFSDKRSKS